MHAQQMSSCHLTRLFALTTQASTLSYTGVLPVARMHLMRCISRYTRIDNCSRCASFSNVIGNGLTLRTKYVYTTNC